MRAGTAYFWVLVGVPSYIAYHVTKDTKKAALTGAAMTAFIFTNANYIHPFGPGPNPLKF